MRVFNVFRVAAVALALSAVSLSAQLRTVPPTYQEAQAVRGRSTHAQSCESCHGADLSGGSAPALAGLDFRRSWSRGVASVESLWYVIDTTMPPKRVEGLTREQKLDVLAYVLERNGVKSSEAPLTATRDQLSGIRLLGAGESLSPDHTRVVTGEWRTPAGKGPSQADLQHSVDDGVNWLHHTHDYAGTRY
ncbi:MAG: cytochrome c [Vicinamibacterales bacterium]